jgi:hypothetical protein
VTLLAVHVRVSVLGTFEVGVAHSFVPHLLRHRSAGWCAETGQSLDTTKGGYSHPRFFSFCWM